MQALILAGGLGKRLRSAVSDKPKPMAEVGSKPFLEHQLEFLKRYQITHLVFCVGYLHRQIEAYFNDGSEWGIKIDYSVEGELLGTGGAIKNAEKFVNGTFLTLNGDSFFDIDLSQLIRFHNNQKLNRNGDECLGTIALTEVFDTRDYGKVILDKEKKILSFNEKVISDSAGIDNACLINAGIYILEPDILKFISSTKKVSLEREVFPSIINMGYYLFGHKLEGFFVDIGTPEGYHKFQSYLEEETHDYQE
jgi:NDP-sugar pyrophosphorylase family protein